jgi:hypothetical protein
MRRPKFGLTFKLGKKLGIILSILEFIYNKTTTSNNSQNVIYSNLITETTYIILVICLNSSSSNILVQNKYRICLSCFSNFYYNIHMISNLFYLYLQLNTKLCSFFF